METVKFTKHCQYVSLAFSDGHVGIYRIFKKHADLLNKFGIPGCIRTMKFIKNETIVLTGGLIREKIHFLNFSKKINTKAQKLPNSPKSQNVNNKIAPKVTDNKKSVPKNNQMFKKKKKTNQQNMIEEGSSKNLFEEILKKPKKPKLKTQNFTKKNRLQKSPQKNKTKKNKKKKQKNNLKQSQTKTGEIKVDLNFENELSESILNLNSFPFPPFNNSANKSQDNTNDMNNIKFVSQNNEISEIVFKKKMSETDSQINIWKNQKLNEDIKVDGEIAKGLNEVDKANIPYENEDFSQSMIVDLHDFHSQLSNGNLNSSKPDNMDEVKFDPAIKIKRTNVENQNFNFKKQNLETPNQTSDVPDEENKIESPKIKDTKDLKKKKSSADKRERDSGKKKRKRKSNSSLLSQSPPRKRNRSKKSKKEKKMRSSKRITAIEDEEDDMVNEENWTKEELIGKFRNERLLNNKLLRTNHKIKAKYKIYRNDANHLKEKVKEYRKQKNELKTKLEMLKNERYRNETDTSRRSQRETERLRNCLKDFRSLTKRIFKNFSKRSGDPKNIKLLNKVIDENLESEFIYLSKTAKKLINRIPSAEEFSKIKHHRKRRRSGNKSQMIEELTDQVNQTEDMMGVLEAFDKMSGDKKRERKRSSKNGKSGRSRVIRIKKGNNAGSDGFQDSQ